MTRQFAVEGLVLATIAAVLGAGLATVGVRALVALAPADIPRIADASVDLRVLLIALVVAIGAGLLFGMVPALQARRVDLQGALKSEGGHGASAGGDRSRLRAILVIAECALAVMLVIGATLLIKSFWRLQNVDAGFRSEGVVKAEYQLPSSRYPVDFRRYPDLKEINGFTRELLQKAERFPASRRQPSPESIRSIPASPTRSASSAAKRRPSPSPRYRCGVSQPAISG